MKLEDVEEARASWMKLEMVCIQLCQGAVSVGCTDKPYIVDSVPDHMVVVAFQKLAAFIPVVVQKPLSSAWKCLDVYLQATDGIIEVISPLNNKQ